MDLNQLASDLFGSKRAESSTAPSTISVMYGIATSDSADGMVSVWLSDNALSPSAAQAEWETVDSYDADAYEGMGESTSIEMPTEVTCFKDDVVRVQLVGAGAAKNPTVVGVVGRGDEQNQRLASIEADYIKTTELEADVARIGFLKADSAVIGDIKADTAKVHDLTADQLSAATGFIADLTAGEVTAESIIADKAKLAQVDTEQLTADHAVIEQLDATYATVGNLNAATARIGDIEADYLKAADMEAEQARVGQLVAGKADIADLTAANGRIDNLESTKADISVLESDYITADTIEATYMHANMSNSDVAWIQNGVIKDGSISNAMINSVSANKLTAGTINGEVINVTNLNADNITAGTINGQRIGEGSLSLDKLSEDVYTEQEVDDKLATMQAEIDGAIETWTGTAVPTLNNSPASSWKTSDERDRHVGDVYFVVNSQSQQNGYNYRFTKSGSTYSWQLIKDSDVTNALQRLSTAEGKITTFDSDISKLKTDTGTLTTKTESLETRMSDAEEDILDKVDTTTFNEVSDTVDQHSQTITQMSQTLSNKADGSTVTSLTQRVSKNEQDITGINTTIGELSTTVESKADSSTVETVSSKLNTVSNTVDGHTQSISSISSTQTTMQGKLDKTIVESTQLWYTKANTTAPSKPTSQVTSTSTSGGAWRTVVPAYSSSYPNYFYCYQWKYSDGTYGWSSVTRDIAMGESQSTSRTAASDASTAKTDAATAVSTANTASTNASDALTKANTADANASTALSTANTAAGDAATAKTDAATAVSTANTASTDASTAVSTANTAKATADKNVKSSLQLWFTKANETAPNKPTSKVTSTSLSGNGWRTVVPTYSASYPFYFYCYQYELADGTYTWSDVVYDRATTENQSNSRSAVSGVSTLTSKTNEISTTVDGHTSKLNSITETQTTIQGSAVKSTVQLWYTKANNTAPSKPTAHVTTNDASKGNQWNLAVPTYNSSYPYYYYCYEHQLLNDTYTWSAVTRDIATEESQSTSRSAKATADKNIKESQQLWYTKANSTAPAKPTSKVTSTATTGGGWRTVVPTYSDSYKHYFYCMQYIAADGTVTWSDVVYDQATTEAQSVARAASADLTEFHQEYATFKQTTQQFESTVGETYATKAALETTDGKVTSLTGRVSTAETSITQNAKDIALRATKTEAAQMAQPNLSPYFSSSPYDRTKNSYWYGMGVNSNYTFTDMGDGWMRVQCTNSGSSVIRVDWYPIKCPSVIAGQPYTWLAEVRNNASTSASSGSDFYLVQTNNCQFWGQKAIRTIEGPSGAGVSINIGTCGESYTLRKVQNAETASDGHWTNSDESNVVGLACWTFRCAANSSIDYEVRLSLYEGEYTGPYKPYVGSQLYASQAELKIANDEISSKVSKDGVISSINQSAESITIDANRVNIAGAAIFTSGRLSETSLNNAYDAKGAAANLIAGGENLVGNFNFVIKYNANYDYLTGTLTSLTTTNTRDNGVYVQFYTGTTTSSAGTFVRQLGVLGNASNVGELIHATFEKASDFTHVRIKFNGDKADAGVNWDVSSIVDGTQLTISCKLDSISSDGKGNGGVLSGINLRTGNMPSRWSLAPQDIPTEIGGRNYAKTRFEMFPVGKSETRQSGVTATITGPSTFTLNGSATTADWFFSAAYVFGGLTLQAGTYKIWYTSPNVNVRVGINNAGNTWFAAGTHCTKDNPFTLEITTAQAYYFTPYASVGDSYSNQEVKLMVECSDKPTDWTPAPEDLQSNAVKRTQRIWYRKSASGAPATPGTASSNWVVKADDGSNAWTKMHIAISSTEKFIYTCEQYEMGDGTVGYTSVLLDNTITVIDGGKIITGSVTANKLDASDINASKVLTVGAMTDAAASSILNSNVPQYRVVTTSYSYTLAQWLTWAAEGYTGSWSAGTSGQGVRAGDTVMLKGINKDNGSAVYVLMTVNTLYSSGAISNATSHGLIDPTAGQRADSIQVGGRNLAKASDAVVTPTTYGALRIYLSEPLEAEQTYVFQLWDVDVSHSAKSTAQLGVDVYYCGGTIKMSGWHGSAYFTNGHADHLQLILTPHSSAATDAEGGSESTSNSISGASSVTNTYINLYNSVPSASGTMNLTVGKWKLEKGNKATDWTPAPEDVDNSILSTSKNFNDQIEQINDGVTQLTDDVRGHEDRLTASEGDLEELRGRLDNLDATTQWLSFNTTNGLIIGDSNNFYTQQKGSEMTFNQVSNGTSVELMSLSGTDGIAGPKVTVSEQISTPLLTSDTWSITLSGDMFSINYIGD